jgi:hypothetical protein
MLTLTREIVENAIQDLATDLHVESERTGALGWRGREGDDLMAILQEEYEGYPPPVADLISPDEAVALFREAVEDRDWHAVQQELAKNGDTAAAQARARRRLAALDLIAGANA